jgi:putative MATE family efflux protein
VARETKVSMTEGPLLGVILRVAVPIVLSNLLTATYQLVNAFFVGRLGADAIAAVAASGPIFYVLVSLGSGLATAGSVLIAQYSGARRGEGVDHIAAQTLLMVAGVAAAFAVFGALTCRPLLRLIGVEPALETLTASYLSISYLGMVPLFGFMAIQGMLQAVGEVRFAFRVMLASVLINAALDPLFIFAFGWGVQGAAIATVCAQTGALAVGLWRILGGGSILRLRPVHFRPDLAHMRRAFGIGLPASIEQATRTFGSLVLMSTAAQFGTDALAVYGMGTRVMFFFFTPMLGLSVATAAVVGQNIGAARMDRAEEAGRLCAWLSFGLLTGVGLLLVPAAPWIMRAMTPGAPALERGASTFVYIFAPFLGVMTIPQVLCGVFRGAGSTRQSMAISLVMQWGVQMPAAWILAFLTPIGVLGVWWSYPAANSAAALICIAWFLKGPWRRNLVTPAGRAAAATPAPAEA